MPSSISGILVIDKPENITSAGVTNRLKKVQGVIKVGHTGTLDPFASGVLVCTLNQATRLSRFFLNSDKTYRATMVLGVETDTLDATGKVVSAAPVGNFSKSDIDAAAKRFEGNIQQVPPVFSALKHNGVPLYAYARKGKPVVKPARLISIEYIRIAHVDLPEISFEVACSSGTYIRSLCADLGKALGCGGHLKTLKRIESGGFSIQEAVPLRDIDPCGSIDAIRDKIMPMADSLRNMDAYVAGKDVIDKVRFGKPLTPEDLGDHASVGKKRYIKLIDGQGCLIAVMTASENGQAYNYCCVFINP
jgi:tRNA pseudouridine55 synthase